MTQTNSPDHKPEKGRERIKIAEFSSFGTTVSHYNSQSEYITHPYRQHPIRLGTWAKVQLVIQRRSTPPGYTVHQPSAFLHPGLYLQSHPAGIQHSHFISNSVDSKSSLHCWDINICHFMPFTSNIVAIKHSHFMTLNKKLFYLQSYLFWLVL